MGVLSDPSEMEGRLTSVSKNVSQLLGDGADLREGAAIRERRCIVDGIAFKAAERIIGG